MQYKREKIIANELPPYSDCENGKSDAHFFFLLLLLLLLLEERESGNGLWFLSQGPWLAIYNQPNRPRRRLSPGLNEEEEEDERHHRHRTRRMLCKTSSLADINRALEGYMYYVCCSS